MSCRYSGIPDDGLARKSIANVSGLLMHYTASWRQPATLRSPHFALAHDRRLESRRLNERGLRIGEIPHPVLAWRNPARGRFRSLDWPPIWSAPSRRKPSQRLALVLVPGRFSRVVNYQDFYRQLLNLQFQT